MKMRLLPFEYSVRNLVRNPLRTTLAVAGSTLVVLLVLVAAAFVRGMGEGLEGGGDDRTVILIGTGSQDSLERSELGAGVASIAAGSIPGIAERLGVPYVSPEIHMATMVQLDAEGENSVFVNLRGVEPSAYLVHAKLRIIEGRAPGVGEFLVGRLAAARMGVPDERLAVGRSLWLDGQEWPISGLFEAPGSVMEAEIWCRLSDLRVATKHENISCVVLTLAEDGDPADVDLFTKQRLDLELVALRESEYLGKVWAFYRPIRAMVWVTAILVAAGAFFGGLNTMYASFARRVRELGALQTLGFTRGAVLVSLIQESFLVSVAGSLLAAGIAMVFLDGIAVRISMGAFGMAVDAPVLALGLGAGLVLGVLGALPPALRCLSLPVAQSLKAS